MPAYNPYNYSNYNPYQELKNMRDRIDNSLQQYQQQQQQNQMMPQQPTNLTQNFQLAPVNNSGLIAKFVEGIDEVKNTFVMQNGLFVNKEMETLWFKNVSGDIKTYSLTEVIEVDPKDVEITNLKNEIANMRQLINQQSTQISQIDNEPEVLPKKTVIAPKVEKKNSK